MSGKGSTPRPIPNREQYESNWDAIYSKMQVKKNTPPKKTPSPKKS